MKSSLEVTHVSIGNKEMFTESGYALPEEIRLKAEELEKQGNTTMIAQQNEKFVGIITLMDVARNDAKDTLIQLKREGIR